ncbi:hypothetical protein ACN27B_08540 [Micromonospora sp. WMMD754]|uniref:hypothetical protein n=1 Tax=Micromonospora sp. WMMD754 TaxID=3404114 RepID=UPI003BF493A3
MTTATLSKQLPAKGPYARVPYCDEHNRAVTGCPKCRAWNNWRLRVWRRRRENGQRATVPVPEIRAHLEKLRAAGMKGRDIYTAAGVSRGTYEAVAYKPNRKFVLADVGEKILAVPVPPKPDRLPPLSNLVDPTGAVRRVHALQRIGWTFRDICEAGGLSTRVEGIATQTWITRDTAAGVRRAYESLSMTPGPSGITAKRAARAGWPPPLAWDDATIDDPNAEPVLNAEPAGDPDAYDPITVGLAVDGRLTYEQIAGNRADLVEVVRRLAKQKTDQQIADHLRWPGADDGEVGKTRGQAAVCKLRNREGIAGPERFEAVYAYRPGGKRTPRTRAKAA